MGELAPEFKQKIANSDGNNEMNNQEKDVIFYVESWARDMPPAYLNKLIDAIKEKLKNKQLSKDQIRIECENAINKLNDDLKKEKKDRTLLEKVKAGVSDVTTKVEILASTEDKIQIFRNGENTSITVKDFEKELKTSNEYIINPLGLANYFQYLHTKGTLTSEILMQKF